MKLSSKNKILIGIGVFVSALIITNPSPTAFKDYIGARSYYGIQRKKNFFIFSEYQYADRYIGVAGNFFKLDTPKSVAKAATNNDMSDNVESKPTLIYDPSNPRESLYDTLVAQGFTEKQLGKKEEFLSALRQPQKALKIYNSLLKIGYNMNVLGTKSEFLHYLSEN